MGRGDAPPLSESVRPEVAFCLWALCRDGLRAAPFDRHGDGDGELRKAGLDAGAWERWLRAVVGAQERHGLAIRGAGPQPADRGVVRRLARAAANPVRFAPPKARGALVRYWRAFGDEGRAWCTDTQPGLICRLVPDEQRAFVGRLKSEAPGLAIYLAPYPVPMAMVVSPRSVVLGMPAADRGTARLARAIILGAVHPALSEGSTAPAAASDRPRSTDPDP